MKFALKDYQETAVRDVLDKLGKARRRWHEERERSSFSLSATTGSGKTVMAAAVFEALFHGNDDYGFHTDHGAVVIWFSDNPNLNEQSKWRLHQVSDRLTPSDLVTVENTFSREKFETGKVYFLNTQKMSKNSLLVRGHDPNGQSLKLDMRSHTIWDTLRNTIEDPDLTLYLVLDEAHRGMGNGGNANERQTIVRKLIDGHGSIPGIPVVWGISATVERFNEAMNDMERHVRLPNVRVAVGKVQESGLLKDTINLDVPNREGNLEAVLLRRGTRTLQLVHDAWSKYTTSQGDADSVIPLMILQVPNKPNPDQIGDWLDTIFEEWPDLSAKCVANVFGEHRTKRFGNHSVPYIEPMRVQESRWVRILIAKDAISTGWDCPRAEVMVSFRVANDQTHITQLLGRMVRTPLARRIPGNERLNAVDCLLPHFREDSVRRVANALMTGEDTNEEITGRRVLIDPVEMKPNPDIPEEAWEKLLSLPSWTLPRLHSHPVKRLTELAHELATDDILPGAGKMAHGKMHQALDGTRMQYREEIASARNKVLTVAGLTISVNTNDNNMTIDEFEEDADHTAIEESYRRSFHGLSPDLARSYSQHLAGNDDDALIDAHVTVVAIGMVENIKSRLHEEAEKLFEGWLEKHRVEIRSLTDDRQDVYRRLREMSSKPMPVDIARPRSRLQETKLRNKDGEVEDLPCFPKHILCDDKGMFPCDLNRWENRVVSRELERAGNIGWYRNPARSSQDSLGVIYEDGDETHRILRPDFIFLSRLPDGRIVADIVDPHGDHHADALPKIRGLADYAENHPNVYRRIEGFAEIAGKARVLDLTEPDVRKIVREAATVREAYESDLANDYI